mmetsp:Transcript_81622/g.189576  ORF Transcript_81622/g.189576 Transcript_81622/m.189576 type:complete len:243 (+) Transcript_81622:713-1441(+)
MALRALPRGRPALLRPVQQARRGGGAGAGAAHRRGRPRRALAAAEALDGPRGEGPALRGLVPGEPRALLGLQQAAPRALAGAGQGRGRARGLPRVLAAELPEHREQRLRRGPPLRPGVRRRRVLRQEPRGQPRLLQGRQLHAGVPLAAGDAQRGLRRGRRPHLGARPEVLRDLAAVAGAAAVPGALRRGVPALPGAAGRAAGRPGHGGGEAAARGAAEPALRHDRGLDGQALDRLPAAQVAR